MSVPSLSLALPGAGLLTLVLATLLSSSSLAQEPPPGPGWITSAVHPGDPLQQIRVTGFRTQGDALRFVQDGFPAPGPTVVVDAVLARGQSARFGEASYLVLSHQDANRQVQLLSLTRSHGDLHLVVGSCGYQVLVNVDLGAPPSEGVWR